MRTDGRFAGFGTPLQMNHSFTARIHRIIKETALSIDTPMSVANCVKFCFGNILNYSICKYNCCLDVDNAVGANRVRPKPPPPYRASAVDMNSLNEVPEEDRHVNCLRTRLAYKINPVSHDFFRCRGFVSEGGTERYALLPHNRL